eukprot:scaffold84711_cov50-Phaeocystis_antarctica.AAC.2
MASEARQQAQAEKLTMPVSDNKTGYFGVAHQPGKLKPYQARVKQVHLGSFATADEAALCIARTPEWQAAAQRAAAAPAPLTSEEARQQAQVEGLTLVVAQNTAVGYFGVTRRPGQHQAYVRRAEEAALCVARSPEGQAVAAKRAAPAAAAPLTSEEAQQQAQAEGLTLRVAKNKTGYCGVLFDQRYLCSKPYQAQVMRGGKQVSLGTFATAEAALFIARSPEGRAAAGNPAVAAPLTSEQARQQAQVEGLTLRVGKTKTGYFGVSLQSHPGLAKPYRAAVKRGDKQVGLGTFATVEEAALCIARSPEGQAAAAAETQGTLPAVPPSASLKEEDTFPPMPPGTFVNKEEGAVPPMPLDAFVKVEVVFKEEEGSYDRPKRQPKK